VACKMVSSKIKCRSVGGPSCESEIDTEIKVTYVKIDPPMSLEYRIQKQWAQYAPRHKTPNSNRRPGHFCKKAHILP
jgi:hypothetical protein